MSVQDENCDDEENETASNSIDEMLSSVLQSKSALQHVFKISRPRKNLPENTDEILYSAKQNGSVTRSNSLMPKFTPECNSLKNSSSHSKYLANANNYVNQRQHDKISVRSTSKIVRSTSTPEINSKFIIPVSSSITKTNTHRRIDFSSDKHEKENNYYPEKRGNMPTMNEYVHSGTSSKLHSNTNCSNGSDDLSRSNSFSGLFRSRSLSRTPYNINGSNYIKNELKPHEAKHSTDELAVRRLECNRAVTTPSDKYSSCYGEKIYGNSSILLLQEKETKTPRTYFPKVVPASQVAKKSNVPAELINSAFKTPSSTVRSSRTKEPCQPSPSPSLALKDSDVITVNNLAYLILRELGKGGSSVVYEVFDLQNRPRKAIKIVKLEQEDEAIRNSYKNEIQILRRLQYSNRIIKLFDYEETPTHLKIVMEAGDVDLARILSEARQKKNAPISPFSIKHYWQGMLLAVQVIHNEGIIHSDLKPSNFLLVNGTLKLIDFGIASSVQQDMTSVFKDMPTGTYNYMSPESLNDIYSGPVINRKDLDKPTFKINMKSDVWSLGCILYNLVYGKTPFQHLKPLQKLVAISNPATTISFPPLSDKNLLDVMQKCLQFDAYKRPSIKELLNHPYLEGAVTPEVSPKKLLVSQCKESEVQSFPSEKK